VKKHKNSLQNYLLDDASIKLAKIFSEISRDSKRKEEFEETLKNSGFVAQLENLLRKNIPVM
jgi:high-affinity nickel permease